MRKVSYQAYAEDDYPSWYIMRTEKKDDVVISEALIYEGLDRTQAVLAEDFLNRNSYYEKR